MHLLRLRAVQHTIVGSVEHRGIRCPCLSLLRDALCAQPSKISS